MLLFTSEEKKEEAAEPAEAVMENACSSLKMCIITTVNFGLRSGGGIGDVLRSPSMEVDFH